jgi:hypothetical protein
MRGNQGTNPSSPSSRDEASEQLEPCYFRGHWQLELRGLGRLDGHLFLRVVVLVFDWFFLSCLIERESGSRLVLAGCLSYSAVRPNMHPPHPEKDPTFSLTATSKTTPSSLCATLKDMCLLCPYWNIVKNVAWGTPNGPASGWALLRDARYQ